MRRAMAVAVLAMMVTGCGAGFSRLMSYGSDLADARTSVDGRNFSLFIHPADDTILITRGTAAALGQGVASGLTLNSIDLTEPKPVWMRAAQWLAEPAGCEVLDAYRIADASWEAPFRCPAGVDLRALAAAHRADLRDGQPLPSP